MTFFRIIILELIIIFNINSNIFAIDFSSYTPSTIYKESTKIESDHKIKETDKTINFIVHPMVLFSITGEYLNQEREISVENKRSLEIFGKTFNKPVVLDIYKYEIFIRDSDGHEYWLPIQENFREAFHKEYYTGCKITLYLLISIIYDHKRLALINEFLIE